MAFTPGQINSYPVIEVLFKTLARTAIQRGDRGFFYIIMEDATNTTLYTEHRSSADVKEADWTPENYNLLKIAFEWYAPFRVVVRNMQPGETIADILLELQQKKVTHLACPFADVTQDSEIITWVKSRGKEDGVVYGTSYATNSDDAGIIQIGNSTFEHRIAGILTAQEYSVGLLGAAAGIPLNISLDNKISPNLISVDTVEPQLGILNFYNDDGAVRINLAINSRITFNDEWKPTTRMIKTYEGMNIVRFDIQDTFRKYWLGNYLNTYENKMAFVNLVNKVYFRNLQPNVLSPDYENQIFIDVEKNKQFIVTEGLDPEDYTETEILRFPTGNDVYLQGDVRFTGTMINLTLEILM